MARTSLLTAGLDVLAASASPPVARLLKELFALDDELQAAHTAATRDDENGERVVAAYEAFLRRREALVAQLEKERVAVPWQLRMRIDDIELTLRERKEKRAAAAAKPKDEKKTKKPQSEAATAASGSSAPSSGDAADGAEKEDEDPLLLLKAMILPSAFVAVVAGVIYSVTALYG